MDNKLQEPTDVDLSGSARGYWLVKVCVLCCICILPNRLAFKLIVHQFHFMLVICIDANDDILGAKILE
jgi:hypothetical protein